MRGHRDLADWADWEERGEGGPDIALELKALVHQFFEPDPTYDSDPSANASTLRFRMWESSVWREELPHIDASNPVDTPST